MIMLMIMTMAVITQETAAIMLMPATTTAIMTTAIMTMASMTTAIMIMVTPATIMLMTTISMTSIAAMITPMTIGTRPELRKRNSGAPDRQPEVSIAQAQILSAGEQAALYRLMTWLSPSFPVGAFSYSSGLEWAVEASDIVDVATLMDWLAAMLADGAGFCDGVFMAQAHRCVTADDAAGLSDVAELAAAFVPSRERQLETTSQGRAFIDIARAAWSCATLEHVIGRLRQPVVYPVAVGIVSAAHGIARDATMHAFLHALTANWISAAARLVPLGQTDSQRALAALEPVVTATGARALAASLDDLGSATFRADLASLRHEAQYTRLFRS
jgi:urease accessory protein